MKLRFGLLFILATSLLQADTLRLRDGRTLEGSFLGGTTRQVRFMTEDGAVKVFSIREVQSLSFTEKEADTAGAAPAPRSTTRRPSTVMRPSADTPAATRASRAIVIPEGTVITVRLIDSIDSDATRAGEKFRASLDDPLVVNDRTVAERGADATLQVVRVQQSGKFTGKDEVALELFEITVNGRNYAVASSYAEVASGSRGARTAKVVGGTAAIGAAIGAIAGGGKGAAIGAAAGAGTGAAIQMATRGQRVQIPSETRLDFTLKQAVSVE